QSMAQHVQIGLAPGNELAVVPDEAIPIVIGGGVCHAVNPPAVQLVKGGAPHHSSAAAILPKLWVFMALQSGPPDTAKGTHGPVKGLASTNNRGQISQHG